MRWRKTEEVRKTGDEAAAERLAESVERFETIAQLGEVPGLSVVFHQNKLRVLPVTHTELADPLPDGLNYKQFGAIQSPVQEILRREMKAHGLEPINDTSDMGGGVTIYTPYGEDLAQFKAFTEAMTSQAVQAELDRVFMDNGIDRHHPAIVERAQRIAAFHRAEAEKATSRIL